MRVLLMVAAILLAFGYGEIDDNSQKKDQGKHNEKRENGFFVTLKKNQGMAAILHQQSYGFGDQAQFIAKYIYFQSILNKQMILLTTIFMNFIKFRFFKLLIVVAKLILQFQSMCLFFGNLVQECDHAECQIVQTIKSLNQQSLFSQVLTHHHTNIEREGALRSEAIPSISNLMEEQREEVCFKVEQQDPPSMEYRCPGQPHYQEENYKQRIQRLESELNELRSLTFWMKTQLEKKGILP